MAPTPAVRSSLARVRGRRSAGDALLQDSRPLEHRHGRLGTTRTRKRGNHRNAEQNDEWAVVRRYMSAKSLAIKVIASPRRSIAGSTGSVGGSGRHKDGRQTEKSNL
jgi:hypothetical protein